MSINRLFLVLILIAIYSVFAPAFKSDFLLKLSFTFFLWAAVAVSVINYLGSYQLIRSRFDRVGWRLMQLLLLLNLTIIARSLLTADAALTTALGNPYNALAFFAPFAVGFVAQANPLHTLNRFLLVSMMVGLVWLGITFMLGWSDHAGTTVNSAWALVQPMVFLIGAIGFFGRMTNHALVAGSIILVWNIGLVLGNRTTMLRVILLYFSRYLNVLPNTIIARFIFPTAILILVIFAFQVISITETGEESVFQILTNYLQELASNGAMNVLEKADTRTFLYAEVISDLVRTGELWLGRGSSGTYFSPYFLQTGEDSDVRLTVEVGFLVYLLKGGIFAAALNISIFLFSSYLAVYKSNNRYMKWAGFMLITHVLILFVENIVALNLYNICIWLFVGFCLSKDIRTLRDADIKLLFSNKIGRLTPNGNGNA